MPYGQASHEHRTVAPDRREALDSMLAAGWTWVEAVEAIESDPRVPHADQAPAGSEDESDL
jgi:hypothetical protein